MPLTVILAQMELNGFGFSTDQCEKLKETLRRRANTIESKARELARRSFAIHSPEDVAQVLFIELGLPPSGDPNTLVTPKRGRQTRRPRHLSTAKGISIEGLACGSRLVWPLSLTLYAMIRQL